MINDNIVSHPDGTRAAVMMALRKSPDVNAEHAKRVLELTKLA